MNLMIEAMLGFLFGSGKLMEALYYDPPPILASSSRPCVARIRYDKMPHIPLMASVRSPISKRSNHRVLCSLGEHQVAFVGVSSGNFPSMRYCKYNGCTCSFNMLMWWFNDETINICTTNQRIILSYNRSY